MWLSGRRNTSKSFRVKSYPNNINKTLNSSTSRWQPTFSIGKQNKHWISRSTTFWGYSRSTYHCLWTCLSSSISSWVSKSGLKDTQRPWNSANTRWRHYRSWWQTPPQTSRHRVSKSSTSWSRSMPDVRRGSPRARTHHFRKSEFGCKKGLTSLRSLMSIRICAPWTISSERSQGSSLPFMKVIWLCNSWGNF